MTERRPAPDLDAALQTLAATPELLVALDFDGVLAPIVSRPSAARPLPESARAVQGLAALPHTTVVLVSGRGLADLAAVSGLAAPVQMVGSHGGEFSDNPGGFLDDDQKRRRSELIAELSRLVNGAPGVALEHKPAGVAVHVRNADPATGARVLDAVRAGPAARPGIHPTEGKAVIDLAVVQVSKGGALDVLRERSNAGAVLFVGDDVTDEAAFARLRPGDVGVKVGDGPSLARYRVAEPPDVAVLLQRLRRLRALR
ncbi:trehalose-phosphatase [Pseudonocardia hispaniensis]|uniref:Trehalose 6-phosphate phosphatase n=1 Tax=Pseudonocardia hispaniensis TaxID=904933 RepID=A0ABW1IZC2_9PSEU